VPCEVYCPGHATARDPIFETPAFPRKLKIAGRGGENALTRTAQRSLFVLVENAKKKVWPREFSPHNTPSPSFFFLFLLFSTIFLIEKNTRFLSNEGDLWGRGEGLM